MKIAIIFCSRELPNFNPLTSTRIRSEEGQQCHFYKAKFKNFQFLSYRNVLYLKRKLRTCTIQNQAEKVWFDWEKLIKNQNFLFLTQNWGRLGVFEVQFLKILKNKFKIFLSQDLDKVERNKVKKFQPFWTHLQGTRGILLRSGPPRPPPP